MHKRKQARPELESLEATILLSGMAAALHPSAQADVSTPAPGTTLTLSGTAHGSFHSVRSSSSTTYDINATGTLTPLGRTTVTGDLHVLSGISSGPPNGTLTLATSQGTLTLQIPESAVIPAGLPTATSSNEIVDTYVITKGTGAYKGDTGSGVVEFTFSPSRSDRAGSVSITFTSTTSTAAPMIPATTVSGGPMIPATTVSGGPMIPATA